MLNCNPPHNGRLETLEELLTKSNLAGPNDASIHCQFLSLIENLVRVTDG